MGVQVHSWGGAVAPTLPPPTFTWRGSEVLPKEHLGSVPPSSNSTGVPGHRATESQIWVQVT